MVRARRDWRVFLRGGMPNLGCHCCPSTAIASLADICEWIKKIRGLTVVRRLSEVEVNSFTWWFRSPMTAKPKDGIVQEEALF